MVFAHFICSLSIRPTEKWNHIILFSSLSSFFYSFFILSNSSKSFNQNVETNSKILNETIFISINNRYHFLSSYIINAWRLLNALKYKYIEILFKICRCCRHYMINICWSSFGNALSRVYIFLQLVFLEKNVKRHSVRTSI